MVGTRRTSRTNDQGSRRLDMGVVIEEIFDDSPGEEEQPRGNGNGHDTCREKGTTSRIVEAYEQGSDCVGPTTTTDTGAEEEDWVKVEEPSFDDGEGADGMNSGRGRARVQEDEDEEEEKNPYIHFNQGDEDVEVISEEERRRRMEEAEGYREEGNKLFKEQNYIEALVCD